MIRFTKIKITSDEKIQLEYQKKNGPYWDEFVMKSAEEALPSFYRAFDNFPQHVEAVCELPEGDHQTHPYEIKSFKFSYGGDAEVMGVTITASRTLVNSNSPLNLNTPHMIESPYSEGGDDTQVMSDDMLSCIYILTDEAQKYLDGERAQGNLFQEDEPKMEIV